MKHLIVVKPSDEFTDVKPFSEQADLIWVFLKLSDGWVVINTNYGYVELIKFRALTKMRAEGTVRKIVREYGTDVSTEDIGWASISEPPKFVRDRYTQVKRLVEESGGLDKAWFHVRRLNQSSFLGTDQWTAEDWIRWKLLEAPRRPGILLRILNTLNWWGPRRGGRY